MATSFRVLIFAGLFLVVAGTFLVPAKACAQTEGMPQNQRADLIKAALIFNVVKFIDWPSRSSASELQICSTTKDKVFEQFVPVFEGKIVKGQKIGVTLSSWNAQSSCQILYVGALDKAGRKVVPQQPGLVTVCQIDEPSYNGCMVQIYEVENKARLAIDYVRLSEAGLRVSSDLRAVAPHIPTPAPDSN